MSTYLHVWVVGEYNQLLGSPIHEAWCAETLIYSTAKPISAKRSNVRHVLDNSKLDNSRGVFLQMNAEDVDCRGPMRL